MEAERSERPSPRGVSAVVCRFVAGLDTGFAGAVVLLVWFIFHSWLANEYWWAKFNVVAGFFFGDRVFISGPGPATVAGASMLIVIYSLLGGVFAFAGRPRGVLVNLFAGLGFALLWQAAADSFVWRRIHPFAPSFLTPAATLPGHLLFGVALARFARRFRAVARAIGDPAWAAVAFPPPPVRVPSGATESGPEPKPETPDVAVSPGDEIAGGNGPPLEESPGTASEVPSEAAAEPFFGPSKENLTKADETERARDASPDC